MQVPAGLTYQDDPGSPKKRAAVYDLLRDTFGVDVSSLAELDLWDSTYRAFSYLDAYGLCVANVATFVLNLVVSGRPARAMGIQSVATRPRWRGQGLSRDLLERALRWCDANATVTYLMTSIPAFYEPFGFRTVPQFMHVGDAPADHPSASPARQLDLAAGEDRALLVRCLRRRAHVSASFAAVGMQGAFVLNLLDEPDLTAWFLPDPDAIVVTGDGTEGTMRIVDVVAPSIPGIRDILAGLGVRPLRLEVHFPPDLLGWAGVAIPAETSTVLMARGDPGPLGPCMLPATAAF